MIPDLLASKDVKLGVRKNRFNGTCTNYGRDIGDEQAKTGWE